MKKGKQFVGMALCLLMLISMVLPVNAEDINNQQEDTVAEQKDTDLAVIPEGGNGENQDMAEPELKDDIEKEKGVDWREGKSEIEGPTEVENQEVQLLEKAAGIQVPQPVGNLRAISLSQGRIQINWDISEGSEGYLIYRMTGNEKKMTYHYTTENNSFIDNTAVVDTYTYYRVFPYIKDSKGIIQIGQSTAYVYAKTTNVPGPVSGLKAQVFNNTQVKLTWNAAEKATGYLIYRKSANESSFKYLYMVSQTGFIDKTAEKDVFSFYRVYPYFNDENGKMVVGQSTAYVYSRPMAAPEPVSGLTANLYYSSQVKLSWTASKEAEGYLIYRKTDSGSFTYRYMVAGNSFIDTTAEAGVYSYYRIYPYFKDSSGKMHTGKSIAYVYAKPIEFPAVTSITTENDSWDGTLQINWSMDYYWANGHEIEGYLIYRRIGNSGDFKYLAMEKKGYYWNYYEDTKASYSENNFYKIYPYYVKEDNTRQVGPCNTFAYGKAKIPGVYGLTVYEQVDQVRVQWVANSNGKADGYDIYRKLGNGNFAYLGTTKGLEYIDKEASKTVINYYVIHPYRVIDGKRIIGLSNGSVSGKAKNYNRGQAIADYGWQFIGTPYVWGGNDLRTGVDCSGFTTQVHLQFGIAIPRTTYTQEYAGVDIGRDLSKALPGDIICYTFDYSEPSNHVAIYLGSGRMIHSSTTYGPDGKSISGIQLGYANYMKIKTIRRFW